MMAGTFYKDKYGSQSIRYDMFKKAKETDPNVKLFLNDYNVISGGQRLTVGWHHLLNVTRVAGGSYVWQLALG